jgi:hypothetical protein
VTGLPVFGQSATLDAFSTDTERVRAEITGPALLVYPELHLFGTDDQSDEHHDQLLQAAAQPLDGESAMAPSTKAGKRISGFDSLPVSQSGRCQNPQIGPSMSAAVSQCAPVGAPVPG